MQQITLNLTFGNFFIAVVAEPFFFGGRGRGSEEFQASSLLIFISDESFSTEPCSCCRKHLMSLTLMNLLVRRQLTQNYVLRYQLNLGNLCSTN